MPQQRMFTVAAPMTMNFAIVWTRSKALARSWGSDNWNIDPVWIDVWPTIREDQEYLHRLGQEEYYA